MGPTYLVLLMAGSAAIVLYEGADENEARHASDAGIAEHRGKNGRVVIATIRSQAMLDVASSAG